MRNGLRRGSGEGGVKGGAKLGEFMNGDRTSDYLSHVSVLS
jgi:hypothetical protein